MSPSGRFCPACGTQTGDPTDPHLEPVTVDDEDQLAAHATELVDCPGCGAANSRRRLLCGACGADLETGAAGGPPTTTIASAHAAGTGTRNRRLSSRPGVRTVVVAAAVVLGVAVGAGLLATGTLDTGPSPEPPDFAEPAAALAVRRAVATSTAGPDHTADLLADRNIATAWRSDSGRTVGQILAIELATPAWVSELHFAVGDQGGPPPYGALARPLRVRVTFPGGDPAGVVVELQDAPGVQRARLRTPRRASQVRIEVLEVASGSLQPSVAVSELVVVGHPVVDVAISMPVVLSG